MITDKKLVERAEKLAAQVKPGESHPDVLALAGSFKRAQESGNDLATQAHARPLVALAGALGVEVKSTGTRTAKKSTAKKPTAKG